MKYLFQIVLKRIAIQPNLHARFLNILQKLASSFIRNGKIIITSYFCASTNHINLSPL
jgi:hypothetical protein